jgi:hypothetical protein
MDLSAYVLLRALPPVQSQVGAILRSLRSNGRDRNALAELNDLLVGLTRTELGEAVADLGLEGLSPFCRNYVAAMVEVAAAQKGIAPPAWVRQIEPLEEPYFEGDLPGLRPYLLRVAPVGFRRRNIFVDATLGARV